MNAILILLAVSPILGLVFGFAILFLVESSCGLGAGTWVSVGGGIAQ
jgi:hypothetical protein